MTEPTRCTWDPYSDLMLRYHDEEWGVPSHDDRHLFEMLILEGAQAGLSWTTILNKRENYRRTFDGFDFEKIARYGEDDVARLLGDAAKRNEFRSLRDLPTSTAESEAMSKELKKRGFRFVGSTICYAFMQAVGMVNDHTTECFLRRKPRRRRQRA